MIKQQNPYFKVEDIDIQDKATFEMVSTGETAGIFQFESAGMKRVLSGLKPDSVEGFNSGYFTL